MNKLYLFFLLFSITNMVYGQTPEWQSAVSYGSSYNPLGTVLYGNDLIKCSDTDNQGNLYVCGEFTGQITLGSITLGTSSQTDRYFIAKFSQSGVCIWANAYYTDTYYRTSINDIDVDDSGNAYITGYYSGSLSIGYVSCGNQVDIFVAKFSTLGNCLWARGAGHVSTSYELSEAGQGVTVDSQGNCYITGMCQGNATFGSFNIPGNTSSRLFIAKLDTVGNWLWVTAFGNGWSDGKKIAVDSSGFSYVIGTASNSIVTKFSTDGTRMWTIYPQSDNPNDIIVGLDDYIYYACSGTDAFIGKVDASGNTIWTRNVIGSGDSIKSLTVFNNCIYVIGSFSNSVSFGSIQISCNGNQGYVSKISSEGNWLWATKTDTVAGGSGSIKCVCPDYQGNFFAVGNFRGSISIGQFGLNSNSIFNDDIFMAKFFDQSYVTYTPQTLLFNSVFLSTSSTLNVTLQSYGVDSLRISNITLNNPNSAFSILDYQLPLVFIQGSILQIPVTFSPLNASNYVDTLYIVNNSFNNPLIKIRLSGSGIYAPPLPPQNLIVNHLGNDMHLSWEPVTMSVLNTPLIPDGYIILYSELSEINDSTYYYLWETPDTSFIHHRVAQFRQRMFYRVVAYVDYGRGITERLRALNGTERKIRLKDLGLE